MSESEIAVGYGGCLPRSSVCRVGTSGGWQASFGWGRGVRAPCLDRHGPQREAPEPARGVRPPVRSSSRVATCGEAGRRFFTLRCRAARAPAWGGASATPLLRLAGRAGHVPDGVPSPLRQALSPVRVRRHRRGTRISPGRPGCRPGSRRLSAAAWWTWWTGLLGNRLRPEPKALLGPWLCPAALVFGQGRERENDV